MELSAAFSTSLSRRPLPELIAERIVAAIAAGVLAPGDRLPSEPQLAKQMSVGRGSLREALAKLQDAGVVEVIRGRGAFVREPPTDDSRMRFALWSRAESARVTQLLEARVGLESTAAGLACERADPADLTSLAAACADHEEAHRTGDLAAMVVTDEEFHRRLVACAHNDVVADLYRTLTPGLKSSAGNSCPGRAPNGGPPTITPGSSRRSPRRTTTPHEKALSPICGRCTPRWWPRRPEATTRRATTAPRYSSDEGPR